jgi:hypothetical protein
MSKSADTSVVSGPSLFLAISGTIRRNRSGRDTPKLTSARIPTPTWRFANPDTDTDGRHRKSVISSPTKRRSPPPAFDFPYTEIGVHVIAVPHGILSPSSLRTVESVGESQKERKKQPRKESDQKKMGKKKSSENMERISEKKYGKKEKVE